MSVKITLEDAPDDEAQRVVIDGLTRFNEAQIGPYPLDPIWAIARDRDGEVVGGVQGFVSWTWLYLHMLWVDETARGSGVGSALLRKIEEAAAAKGCLNVLLYTFSFQAPDFYRRHGYQAFGELEGFPGDNRQFWMRKALKGSAQP